MTESLVSAKRAELVEVGRLDGSCSWSVAAYSSSASESGDVRWSVRAGGQEGREMAGGLHFGEELKEGAGERCCCVLVAWSAGGDDADKGGDSGGRGSGRRA